MLSEHQSNVLAKFLGWGSLLVTIIVYNGTGFDAVNLPKQFILIIWSGLCLGIWLTSMKIFKSNHLKYFGLTLFVFLIGILISTLLSTEPFIVNFYGTTGRNTGALTYIGLIIIMLSASLLRSKNQIFLVLKFFTASLIFNVIYVIYVSLTKKDPFPWNNPYGNFLGTLGNPDFISAFLGIGFAITLNLVFIKQLSKWLKIILVISFPIEIYLIKETKALQGLLVAALGMSVWLFFYLLPRVTKKIIYLYTSAVGILGIFTVLGMLQIGPITDLVYKTSISIRGEYWRAGINMFKHSPIWGIGLDSYGNYFRRFRDLSAITLPGVNVVTDCAHNVFIDILAGGGLLLFVPYLILQAVVLKKIIVRLRNSKEFDPIFVSLIVGWVCYLAQSLVSINQIGLAIWGWIFAGLLLAYTKPDLEHNFSNLISKHQNKKIQKTKELSPGNFIATAITVIIAALAILPPVIREHSWRNSLSGKKIEKIYETTNAWPQNNQRYIQTAQILIRSNLGDETLKIVKDGISFDPDFRDYWFFLYNISANEKDKALALENLKRLDPLNPEYK